MDSLREATKNTMFDQWLDAVQGGSSSATGGDASVVQPWTPTAGQMQAAAAHGLQQQAQVDTQLQLAEIAGYLAGEDSSAGHHSCPAHGAAAAAAAGGVLGLSAAASHQHQHAHETALLQQQQTEVSGTVAESTNYVPGWEDIFNINQKQLEGAIRRVSNDPNLEPQRKAYLIQNIMVSRYIVTQQRRMRTEGSREGSGILPAAVAAVAAGAAGSSGAGVAGHAAAAGHSCCHHHHHHHHGHAHHGAQQLGGHAAAAGHQHVATAGVTHQQQLLQAGAGSSSSGIGAAVVAAAAASAAGGGGVAAAVAAAGGVCHQTYTDSTSSILGCKHYRRAARLVAPCCGQVFTCRCA